MTPTLISSQPARSGLREVIFTLLDDAGVLHGPVVEFRPIGDDVNAFLSDRAANAVASLRDGEILQNVNSIVLFGSLASPTLIYSTAAQNFAALRLAYQTATRIEAVMIADFLSTLSNAQLQTAFSMTAGQVTTLRTNKLTPAANLATSIRASSGQ